MLKYLNKKFLKTKKKLIKLSSPDSNTNAIDDSYFKKVLLFFRFLFILFK